MLDVHVQHRLGDFQLDARFRTERDTGVVGLTGPSGAGKSSLLRAVAGLLRPEAGRVQLGERVLLDRAAGIDVPVHQRRLGVVFQDSRLFPHLSVRQNLAYGQRGSRGKNGTGPGRAGQTNIVDMLGIGHLLDRRPASLSGGERQRVAIGRALLTEPALLLMDEPLASLDDARKQELLPFLAELPRSAAVPIVYVSHSLDELLQLADELVVMAEGRVVAQGDVAEAATHVAGPGAMDAVVEGIVENGTLRVGPGLALRAIGLEGAPEGQRVRVRVRADDVLLAVGDVPRMSVRNRLAARVEAVRAVGRGLVVDLALVESTVRLRARITQAAADELGLRPGLAVTAMVKAASIRVPGLVRLG